MRRGPRSIGPRRLSEHATSPVRALDARSESFGRFFCGAATATDESGPSRSSMRNRCGRASAMQPSVGAYPRFATCMKRRCPASARADARCSPAQRRHRRARPRARAAPRRRDTGGERADCSCGRPAHRTSRRTGAWPTPADACADGPRGRDDRGRHAPATGPMAWRHPPPVCAHDIPNDQAHTGTSAVPASANPGRQPPTASTRR